MTAATPREDGEPFDANRIVLPNEDHFLPVTVFLCEEFIRLEIETRPAAEAFADAEPLVEMALRRTVLGDESVLGLLGELCFLEELLRVARLRTGQ